MNKKLYNINKSLYLSRIKRCKECMWILYLFKYRFYFSNLVSLMPLTQLNFFKRLGFSLTINGQVKKCDSSIKKLPPFPGASNVQ